MNKEELELYDMVLNSEKSFDVNYKELAISLRAELEETEDRIQKAIEYIEQEDEWVKNSDYRLLKTEKILDILKGGNK